MLRTIRKAALPEGWDAARFAEELSIEPEELVVPVMELCDEEDLDPELINFKEGYWGWSEGHNCGIVEEGSTEYGVAPDFDTAYNLAVAMVRDQLETEPELFNQSWLAHYIDEDKLRDVLKYDLTNARYDDVSYDLDHLENLDTYSDLVRIDDTDFEDEEELAEALREHIDTIAEALVDQELDDPIDYLKDLFGDEAIGKAMEWAGVNLDEAADDAVNQDGPGHFLSGYDGELRDLSSGGVYWRTN